MFAQYMVNTWLAAGIVAVVAGATGYFAVLRNAAFAAHTLPQSAFAGAAGAFLLGWSTLLGLGVFAALGALAIGLLGRSGRHDVVTALSFVTMLALGSLFLSFGHAYAPEVFTLLFGEVVGVSRSDLATIALLGLASVVAIGVVARPLLLASVLPDAAAARGLSPAAMDQCFLLVLAVTTTATVPVVGAFLMFSLMIAPAAAARSLTARPGVAALLSSLLALAVAWASVAVSYWTAWPVAFYVGAFGIAVFALARSWAALGRRPLRHLRAPAAVAAQPARGAPDLAGGVLP